MLQHCIPQASAVSAVHLGRAVAVNGPIVAAAASGGVGVGCTVGGVGGRVVGRAIANAGCRCSAICICVRAVGAT